ncbi:hypothetical protein Smp_175240 [Schistosoma mansoni]|uniref:Secreted protein n=1 Tax=Schistosoma mansoni TaxID=6183 RepID=C4QMW5_SCHMA|nr:hypothetical protein Smp_175240 [Schistosoma mansoni]|eukprot:XP_018644425.1 hypothetical protein Smp_175240 [Schistosoma mansoni]
MKLILLFILLIFLNVDLSKETPIDSGNSTEKNMDCEMKVIKGIQQLIIQSSGQNQTLIESILKTDNLEGKLHGLIATFISSIGEQINGQDSP